MNITAFLTTGWVSAFGWMLVHSLWQSALCTAGIVIALRIIPQRMSHLRYFVAVAGLSLVFILSVATFLKLNSSTSGIESISRVWLNHEISIAPKTLTPHWVDAMFLSVRTFIQSNIPSIVVFWCVGALLFSARVLGGWWYVKALRDESIPAEAQWSQHISHLGAQLGIARAVRLAESVRIHAPIVIGYLKPLILIPLGMCSGLTTAQLDSILVHELTHIRRGDYLVNLIQSVLEGLYFFNPFVWIASGIIRREREHCCDDAVVSFQGNPLAYAHALTSLEAGRLSRSGLALSLAENKKHLLHRIKRIMEKSVQHHPNSGRIVPAFLLVIALACTSWISIQTGKSDGGPGAISFSPQKPIAATDTTIKREKSARYYRKQTNQADDNSSEEITEVVEGDEDLRSLVEDMQFDFPIPPVAEIMAIEFVMPPMPPTNFNFSIAQTIHPMPFNFDIDSIPDVGAVWGDREAWDAFSNTFETQFQENFQEFYKDHQVELKHMMEEMEKTLNRQFDQARVEDMSSRAAELADMAAAKVDAIARNRDALELQEASLKKMEEKMGYWQEDQAAYLAKMGEDLKAMEAYMRAAERELQAQLIKDGYLKTDEKVNNIHIKDDQVEINGKLIRPTDQEKYKKLLHNFSPPRPVMPFEPAKGRLE